MLKVENISVTIAGTSIVSDICFELNKNDIFTISGPNGAGKTMLIKAIMGIIPHKGKAFLDGKDISTINPKDLAKEIGVLSQRHNIQFDYQVRQVVELGRYCHKKGLFATLTDNDNDIIDNAMEITGIKQLQHRSILTLSGGELQRVFLAQIFTQRPKIIILDEPTNHLDLQYQIEIFEIVKEWVKEGDRSVMAIVHDLNFVYTYATKALLIKDGVNYSYGKVSDVLSCDNLKNVYNIDVYNWMNKLTSHWR